MLFCHTWWRSHDTEVMSDMREHLHLNPKHVKECETQTPKAKYIPLPTFCCLFTRKMILKPIQTIRNQKDTQTNTTK